MRLNSAIVAFALSFAAISSPGFRPAIVAPAQAGEAYDLAGELPAMASNRSEGALCAEKDNVFVPLVSSAVRSFRIQAIHPVYAGLIQTDRWAPDWTSCDMSNDPSFGAADRTRRVTLYETADLQIVGYTFPSFWRPNDVPVRVGERTERGLHLIQLWTRHRERAEEVLVLYPPDGYWRARPLPFADLRFAAYGSSFLVGPVETQGRPIVALRSVAFDPETKTFTLDYARGGSAQVKLSALDQDRLTLDVRFSEATPDGLPFAALRSMYVTEANADVARMAWREKNATAWGESSVMDFPGAAVTELWAGRLTPSRHNTSAPDMTFSRFRAD
jgi:hypothetical protein